MFGASLLLALAATTTAPAAIAPPPSQIEVSGTGTVRTLPEIATIAYAVRGEGATSDEAVQALEATRKAIADGAVQITPAKFEDGELEIGPVRGDDCKEDYGTKVLSKGACAIVGYVASMDVIARIASTKDAATLVGLIGRLKGHEPKVASFGLADPAAARNAALAAATREARASAEALAKATGARLGRLISLTTDGRGEIEAAAEVGFANVAPPPAMRLQPVRVAITPGPIETEATVTATYELLP